MNSTVHFGTRLTMNNQLVQNTSPVTTTEIYKLVGEKVTARWVALGQIDSDTHWAYGREAEALIPEFPAMVVYAAIAKKAGKKSETIRRAYYTYKKFDEATREKYNLAPYSVFRHAATQPDPEAVLKHYIEKNCSVDEIEAVFQDENNGDLFEEYFRSSGYDRIFYGVFREVYGTGRVSEVKQHVDAIVQIIKEVNEYER